MKKVDKVGEKALAVIKISQGIIAIETNEEYARAEEIRQELVNRMKDVDAAYDDIIKAAHATWKASLAKKAHYYDKLKEAATFIKGLQAEYKQIAANARKAEETRLRAEAIEAERIRREQEAAMAPEDEREMILNEPINIAPVVLPDTLPSGPVFRTLWDAEVVNFIELIRAVANGNCAEDALLPNTKYLRGMAIAQKDTLRIPGVRSYSRTV